MKGIGSLLVLLGAGSFVLNMVGYEFSLLMWIDNWGVEVGWAIRGAMVVAGGALWYFGGGLGGHADSSEERQEPDMPRRAESE
jgi:hypothetical protein